MEKYSYYSSINISNLDVNSSYVLEGNNNQYLQNMKRVNMFVGANNCGKSRLLRALFSADTFNYTNNTIEMSIVHKAAEELDAEIKNWLNPVESMDEINHNLFSCWVKLEAFGEKERSFNHFKQLVGALSQKSTLRSWSSSIHNKDRALNSIRQKAAHVMQSIDILDDNLGGESKVYIPIMRGLRPILDTNKDVYKERTIKDYQFNLNDKKRKIFTGLDLYSELLSLLLGEKKNREIVNEYEDFLTTEFFEGKRVEIVPRYGADTVYIRIGDNNDTPIYLLGDGVQSIIILTFLAFTREERTLFFIEEPDIYLHPSMQRKYLEILLRHGKFRNHQIFFTTHSNHFLDMTADYPNISTFLFKKETDKFRIRNATVGDKGILHEIGARSSSIFLTNTSIWVEGVTDRLYLREWIRKYVSTNNLLPIREDTHFSIIEYGGGNLVHFKFSDISEEIINKIEVSRICSDSILIMDGDSTEKSNRLDKYLEQLGEKLICLPCKEIENLIPIEILRVAIKNIILRSERISDFDVSKIEHIREEGYQTANIGIGEYLDKALEIEYFSSPSGTIKQKMRLCEEVIKVMQADEVEWNLSKELSNICEKIYGLVINSNKNN